MSDKLKQFFKLNLIVLVGITFLTASLLPEDAMAFRRNHRYHQHTNRVRLAATPQPSPNPAPSPVLTLVPPTVEIGNDLIKGRWDFLAGATNTADGLLISPTGIEIVSQDGQDSMANPPINLAGTYLDEIKGDLSITTLMQIPNETTATIQLYGNPPLIADEFRVEGPSVQMTVEGSEMKVSVWSGKANAAPTTETFSIPGDPTLLLKVARQADTLEFSADNKVIGEIKAPTLFTSGKLWFGFDSVGGDWLLTSLQMETQDGGTFQIADGSVLEITEHNPQGLQLLATEKRPGFLIGMAQALGPIVSDPDYAKVALDSNMFGSITPENDTKMINLQPMRGVYTFQKVDALISLAKQNGINDIHGHALVFAEANPMWFNRLPVRSAADKKAVEEVMVDHITTVIKHFGPTVQSWDVVNEPIADYDDMDEGATFRNHKWYQAMGEDYIIKAFKAAYDASPQAILSINEYGLEEDGERWDAFLEIMEQLKSDLEEQNIPQENITVGFQSHVYETGDRINPTVLKKHIQTLDKLGFKSQISENDVYSDDGTNIQSQQYSAILNACISEPGCIAWRGWIMSDKYDVFEDDGNVEYGEDGLFGKTMNARPALSAMQQILR